MSSLLGSIPTGVAQGGSGTHRIKQTGIPIAIKLTGSGTIPLIKIVYVHVLKQCDSNE